MNFKHTLLVVAMVPALALLGACNKHDADDTTPAADTAAPAADAMPADSTAPADSTMPAGDTSTGAMSGDNMSSDSMSSGSMSADNTMSMGDQMSFADMDKNHDGGVTKDELSSTDMLMQHFATADTDGDGKLSEAEVTKHRADMMANRPK